MFSCVCIHAREPLYSISAFIVGRLQSMRAQNNFIQYYILVYCVPFFTDINFHDDVSVCNYHLGIVVHSGFIGAFKY